MIRKKECMLVLVVALMASVTAFGSPMNPGFTDAGQVNIAGLSTATADSQYTCFGPQHLIDEDYVFSADSTWISGDTTIGHWVVLTWDDEISFNEVNLYSMDSRPEDAIKRFWIQYKDAATGSWVTVNEVENNTDLIYQFNSATSYLTKQFRLYIWEPNSVVPAYNHARMLEIQIGGTVVPEPITMTLLAVGGLVGLKRRKM